MKIGFTVGEVEQHQMVLSFDHKSGDLEVLMDGTQVLADCPVLALDRVNSYELSIGIYEKHRLSFRLAYGVDPDVAGARAIPRLMVTAIL